MKAIIDILRQFATIGKPARRALIETVKQEEHPKGALLLEQGKTCRHLYFLVSGCTRGFYYQDGKDITAWFASEQDIVTSLYSFVTQKPSLEGIEVLEDTLLYKLSYEQLQQFYNQYPELNTIGRLITEKYYLVLEERTLSLQFQSAQQRYQQLIAHQPELLQRASLGHIASFLGITQETLSRIRAKS